MHSDRDYQTIGDRELDVLRYVAGEMEPAEAAAFESALAEDLELCELVAECVRVTRTIAAAERVLHEAVAPRCGGATAEAGSEAVGRSSRWSTLGRMLVPALLSAAAIVAVLVSPRVWKAIDGVGESGAGPAVTRRGTVLPGKHPAVSAVDGPAVAEAEAVERRNDHWPAGGDEGVDAGVPTEVAEPDLSLAAAWVRLTEPVATGAAAMDGAAPGEMTLPEGLADETAVSRPFDESRRSRDVPEGGLTDPVVAAEGGWREFELPDWVMSAVASETATEDDASWQ
ncbi:MAG: hypothetical protein D6725_13860 [Planctomycetota bacterium]|nr:MAG: hypothetical protein D6725_13860 [Planctomycetota bacterium]